MVPKYVFLFIGDGMSYPQIQATAYFNGAQQRGEESTIERVSFMDFPVIGSQYTYDSTSFCPDSASTATSIASGRKKMCIRDRYYMYPPLELQNTIYCGSDGE